MENIVGARDRTLSFKTTQEDKIKLQQLANEKNVTRSEFVASVVHAYMPYYDFIGKAFPREQAFQKELEKVNRENRKLILELENANNRIDMEQRANRKFVGEQFKLNKTIFDLREELKTVNMEMYRLNEAIKSNQPIEKKNVDTNLLMGSIGSIVLSGLALMVAPVLFKK